MSEPLISVLMVNCNHADTIADSLRSVLDQTYENLQVIVVDDGSTDGSVEAIDPLLSDPRVELHRLPRNRHICQATNIGFSLVRGEWLARIDSDDVWYPNRLERQLRALAERPEFDICFSWCDWIDENGNDATEYVSTLPEGRPVAYETQREWLRHFYYECNCLIHSSVLMRTSLMRETGGFELAYRQLHDFDYWVRIAKRRNLLVVPERLLAMRKFVGLDNADRNASKANQRNITRTFNEYLDIRAHMFDDMADDVFVEAFGEDFVRPDSSSPDELACERAFLLCRPQSNWDVRVTPAGLRALKDLLDRPETRELLEERYDFPVQRFYELATEHTYFDLIVKNDLHTSEELVRALRAEGDGHRSAISALEGEIESLRGHVKALESLVDEKDFEIGSLHAEIDDMRGSTSWRVTRPLRALGALAGGGKKSPARDEGKAPEANEAPAPPARPTILVQAHLSGNLGDDLFVRTLCKRYPNADFEIALEGDYAGRLSDVANLTLHDVSSFGTLVSTADAVVHISGSCFIRTRDNFRAFFEADEFLTKHARRLFFIGGNFGPYEHDDFLDAYRRLFRDYDGITFRDRYSVGLFPDAANVAYAPDVLFGYPAHVRPKSHKAVVCPISLRGRDGSFGISQYADAYRGFTVGVVRALVDRGLEVTLASFNESQGDEREVLELVSALPDETREQIRVSLYRKRPEEVLADFEDAECVVATRFHAMVLGIAHGCKVMTVSYDQKTEKVVEDLGFENCVRLEELETADAEGMTDRLLSSDVVDVTDLARGSEGHFRFLDEWLRGEGWLEG